MYGEWWDGDNQCWWTAWDGEGEEEEPCEDGEVEESEVEMYYLMSFLKRWMKINTFMCSHSSVDPPLGNVNDDLRAHRGAKAERRRARTSLEEFKISGKVPRQTLK